MISRPFRRGLLETAVRAPARDGSTGSDEANCNASACRAQPDLASSPRALRHRGPGPRRALADLRAARSPCMSLPHPRAPRPRRSNSRTSPVWSYSARPGPDHKISCGAQLFVRRGGDEPGHATHALGFVRGGITGAAYSEIVVRFLRSGRADRRLFLLGRRAGGTRGAASYRLSAIASRGSRRLDFMPR